MKQFNWKLGHNNCKTYGKRISLFRRRKGYITLHAWDIEQ